MVTVTNTFKKENMVMVTGRDGRSDTFSRSKYHLNGKGSIMQNRLCRYFNRVTTLFEALMHVSTARSIKNMETRAKHKVCYYRLKNINIIS